MRQSQSIPNDEALDGMSYVEMRSLAEDTPLDPADVKEYKLRQWLKRYRDGATVLQCPKETCGYRWPYTGDAPHHTSCPRCQTSVVLKANTVEE